MGYTRNTGQLSYLITYDGSGNITVPASFTQTTVTSSMLKADSAGKLVAAVAGTDFVAPAGLSAYVPTTRTITINGTTFDLSADRSWSIVSGVSSFNTRTGAITLSSSDVTTALGYTPVTNARTLTINGTTFDLSANRSWTIVAGLSSFNTRTGDITLLDTDVTGALGYTPVTNARTITINGTTFDLSANRTWVVDTSSVSTRVVQKFTATAGQTTFTITGGYTVGMVDVFLNGVKLDNATEFTASNGSTVVLSSAAVVNDVVEVYKYGGQFIANNTLRQTTAFTATAGQTTFTVNYSVGFVDVFYNGAKLAAAEFTATNGTSIVLGTACVVNDIVEVVAYNYTVGAFTGVGGSGTTNYIPKWTASGTLGNSLIFDNGTNVGIGTTSPFAIADTNLTVNGTTGSAIQLGFNGTRYGQFYTDSGEIRLSAVANLPLTFYSNNLERMRISATGNVGIGTSSATSRLTISGDLTVQGGTLSVFGFGLQMNSTFAFSGTAYRTAIFAYNTGDANGIQLGYDASAGTGIIAASTNGAGAGTAFWTFNGSSWGERMRITSGGNVGIGTTIPNSLLQLTGNNATIYDASVDSGQDDGGVTLTIRNNDTSAVGSFSQIDMMVSGDSGRAIGRIVTIRTASATSDMTFVTESGNTKSEKMRITGAGQILTPAQPAFFAYGNSNGVFNTINGDYLIYPAVSFNRGNHYNASNGIFTAPIAGVYYFSWSTIGGNDNDVYRSYLRINNSTFLGDYHLRQDTGATGAEYGTNGNRSVLINLAANDQVRIFFRTDNVNSMYGRGATSDPYFNFMGHLIG
jgi:hypothetical protein